MAKELGDSEDTYDKFYDIIANDDGFRVYIEGHDSGADRVLALAHDAQNKINKTNKNGWREFLNGAWEKLEFSEESIQISGKMRMYSDVVGGKFGLKLESDGREDKYVTVSNMEISDVGFEFDDDGDGTSIVLAGVLDTDKGNDDEDDEMFVYFHIDQIDGIFPPYPSSDGLDYFVASNFGDVKNTIDSIAELDEPQGRIIEALQGLELEINWSRYFSNVSRIEAITSLNDYVSNKLENVLRRSAHYDFDVSGDVFLDGSRKIQKTIDRTLHDLRYKYTQLMSIGERDEIEKFVVVFGMHQPLPRPREDSVLPILIPLKSVRGFIEKNPPDDELVFDENAAIKEGEYGEYSPLITSINKIMGEAATDAAEKFEGAAEESREIETPKDTTELDVRIEKLMKYRELLHEINRAAMEMFGGDRRYTEEQAGAQAMIFDKIVNSLGFWELLEELESPPIEVCGDGLTYMDYSLQIKYSDKDCLVVFENPKVSAADGFESVTGFLVSIEGKTDRKPDEDLCKVNMYIRLERAFPPDGGRSLRINFDDSREGVKLDKKDFAYVDLTQKNSFNLPELNIYERALESKVGLQKLPDEVRELVESQVGLLEASVENALKVEEYSPYDDLSNLKDMSMKITGNEDVVETVAQNIENITKGMHVYVSADFIDEHGRRDSYDNVSVIIHNVLSRNVHVDEPQLLLRVSVVDEDTESLKTVAIPVNSIRELRF